MDSFPIIRIVAKLIIPYILLFGFYVQFHGDFGPGGGFQAGVILASALILYGLVFGLPAVKKVAPPKLIEKLIALGLLIYAGTGVVTMLCGKAKDAGHAAVGHTDHVDGGLHGELHPEPVRVMANFLDYGALDHHFLSGILPHGQHLGIFLIEFGVGVTVTAVMTMIFYCFAGRHPETNSEATP
jgi:multicomponent Na+:H+ antiporter subunit B